jgi:hypothetical protein
VNAETVLNLTSLEIAQLATPVVFVAIVGALVVFGPRRGRMLPDEKDRVFRLLRTFVSVGATGVASAYMDRWLGTHFGLSYWASFGVMLGIAVVVGLVAEGVRSLIARRSERAW